MTTPYNTISPSPARHRRASTSTMADRRALRWASQVMSTRAGSLGVDDLVDDVADLRRRHVLVPHRLLGLHEALAVDLGGRDDLRAGLEHGSARRGLLGHPQRLVVGHRLLGGLADGGLLVGAQR